MLYIHANPTKSKGLTPVCYLINYWHYHDYALLPMKAASQQALSLYLLKVKAIWSKYFQSYGQYYKKNPLLKRATFVCLLFLVYYYSTECSYLNLAYIYKFITPGCKKS